MLFVASGAEFQLAYVIAGALKLAGGALGGYAAQRGYQRSAAAPAANRIL